MAYTLVQQGSGNSASSSTSLSKTMGSAPTAGNLLVYMMAGDKNTGALTLTGWTQVFTLLSTSVSLYVAWKVSDGSETTINASWATSSAAGNTVAVNEYTNGAIPTGTWSLSGSASNVTTEATVLTRPTGTTATLSADSIAVAAAAIDSSQSITTVSAWGNSYRTLFSSTGLGGRGAVCTADQVLASSGATTSSTFTYTGTADQVSAAVVAFTKTATGGATSLPNVVMAPYRT